MVLKKPALSVSMPPRVRIRREATGISGADLARRVGVSPAYVSQIEKGIRVPDIPVAMRIAHALDDDEALYVAWSRDHKATSRSKTPRTGDDDAWARLYRSDRLALEDDATFDRAVRSGADLPPPTGTADEVYSLKSGCSVAGSAPAFDPGPSLVTAPVLEPGKDPGERDDVPRQLRIDEVVLDPRLLPGTRLGRPFVFRADEEVSRRVTDRVSPGDRVVVSRDLEAAAPEPGRIYALRREGRVFLARLARFGERFLVQPGPGETEMLDLGLRADGPAKPAVAGEVVAVVKG